MNPDTGHSGPRAGIGAFARSSECGHSFLRKPSVNRMASKDLLTSGRIVCLDYLRAIACLLVVCGHIVLVGTNDPKTVSIWVPTVTHSLFNYADNLYAQALDQAAIWGKLGVGALGVSIFFLISGFVILRATDREGWGTFLIRRAFRIYPTSVVTMLFTAGVATLYCWAYRAENPNSLASAVASGLLLSNYTHTFLSSPILWSLEVEVIFYLMIGLAAAWRKCISQNAILAMSCGCLAVTNILDSAANHGGSGMLLHFSFISSDVAFLLVGSMIFRQLDQGLTKVSCAYLAAAVSIFFLTYACHSLSTNGQGLGIDVPNTLYALAIFAAALALRMEWRWIRPLGWIAAISYPLYLVHVPLGWFVLVSLQGMGANIHEAVIGALAVAMLAAWALHIIVEKPSQRWGRKIGRRPFAVVPEIRTVA